MRKRISAKQTERVHSALDRLLNLVLSAKRELNSLRETSVNNSADPVERIASWLYLNWYSVADSINDSATSSGKHDLTSSLRAAAASASSWEHGWVVLKTESRGRCLAGRAGVTRFFEPADYANVSRPAAPVAPGDAVAILNRVDWVDPASKFWTTQSLTGGPSFPLVRIYISVGHDQVGFVLRPLLQMLDHTHVKYSLKCPSRATDYARVDALVVYLEHAAWPRCRRIVEKLARQLSPHLRRSVPPFTLPLSRGVAFAEDEPGAQSFGQARCRALAAGVIAVLAGSPLPRAEALSRLSESLCNHGVDPLRPWLSTKTHANSN